MSVVPEPEFLVVGQLSKPHGTKGEILVWPLTDRPEAIFGGGRELLLGDTEGGMGDSPEPIVVESSRPYRRGVLVQLRGVADRTAAQELAGRYVLLPKAELGEPAEDELYYHQLLGLLVETAAGEPVGRVREVFETEPTHLLEVKGESKVHLVPFTSRIVTRVDLEAGKLVIEPPDGLLDL